MMAALPSPAIAEVPQVSTRRFVLETLHNLYAGRDPATVKSITFEGKQIAQDLVENDHPLTAPFLLAGVSAIKRSDDLVGMVEHSTEDDGRSPPREVTLSRTLMVTVSTNDGETSRSVNAAAPGWWLTNPVAALEAALRAHDLAFAEDELWHGATQHVVTFHDGSIPVRLTIGAMTGLPSAVEATVSYDDQHLPSSISWNALGDLRQRTEYLNWSVVEGLRFPLQQDTLVDGQLIRTVSISKASLDEPVDRADLDLRPGEEFTPASVQDFRIDQKVPGPYPNRPIAEIAPGIIQIPNSWYSTIVRQDDGLVIIDAPISAGYAKSILQEAQRRYPGLPVKALITSTGFFWHVAGVREFAACGIPIYAEERNVPVIERLLSSPHTLVPDDLSKMVHPRWTVVPINHKTIIGTGKNAIELYPISQATQPMLMSYIRSQKLLHTGEMVQPLGPNGSILFPESLVELIHTAKVDGLEVDRMIGMHMSPTPWGALATTLKAADASP